MMADYIEPVSGLGSRIVSFRKKHKLTQADLAERYNVSGPAIFKFEKGFVTPSLKLWQRIAADIGIPEKEAVLLWVKEKLPPRMSGLISERSHLDIETVRKDVEQAYKEPNALRRVREVIIENSDISPSLKRFVSHAKSWQILKPTAKEVMFLVELDQALTRLTVEQFRDALLVGREIQAGT